MSSCWITKQLEILIKSRFPHERRNEMWNGIIISREKCFSSYFLLFNPQLCTYFAHFICSLCCSPFIFENHKNVFTVEMARVREWDEDWLCKRQEGNEMLGMWMKISRIWNVMREFQIFSSPFYFMFVAASRIYKKIPNGNFSSSHSLTHHLTST